MEIGDGEEVLWYADIANYLAGGVINKSLMYQQRKKLISDAKYYFWEKPFLFRICADEMIVDVCIGEKQGKFLMIVTMGLGVDTTVQQLRARR